MSEDTRPPENGEPGPAQEPNDIHIELLGAEDEPQEQGVAPGSGADYVAPAATGPDALEADTLVIEPDDLDDLASPAPKAGPYETLLPPVDSAAPSVGIPAKKGQTDLFTGGLLGSLLLQMLVAGALGGFVAWALREPTARAHEVMPLPETLVGWLIDRALLGATLGGFIGLALGAVEGAVIGAWSRAAAGAGLGMLIGGSGGAIGVIIGQRVYDVILSGGDVGSQMGALSLRMLARSVAWSVVGAFVGIGPGVTLMAPKKVVNGLIGGLAGGFIGGLLFDPIGEVFHVLGGAGGTPSRFVGTIVLGMCTGVGIGIAEEVRKEAWLTVLSGHLAGKQFIIYKDLTWLGSAPTMDIPFMKEPDITPKHCSLHMTGASCVLSAAGGATFVNGQSVSSQRLNSGDVIQLGGVALEYGTRPLATDPRLR